MTRMQSPFKFMAYSYYTEPILGSKFFIEIQRHNLFNGNF